MHVCGSMVMAVLVKYWIYICGGMFFFVSFEGDIVMYKIIYMMMFLSCVALYQVPLTTLTQLQGNNRKTQMSPSEAGFRSRKTC